ncbi:DUF5694 domain-containing protein [Xanthomonas sp. SS]|uniref:DUF5694 domain-containing protein n=1 Tax=Xanthomonas sp. SS TaxID=2724122 RepID=UPI00163AE24F|nr:DUF5694 domain-containing protein [Xanthomonas sp. SS]
MNVHRFFVVALSACLTTVPALAAAATQAPVAPAKVMMLGSFHFENPGRDMVKFKVSDVMSKDNQAYLAGLAARLAAFRPTDVLVECDPSEQANYDAAFARYRDGQSTLPANETHQIGFRVAKASGIARVTCFDEGKVGWEADPMFDYIKANDPAMQATMDATFKALSERADREQSTLPLAELLRLTNDPARDRENKNLYISTNAVDAGGSFVGADAAASWWHRNFRMYANVQKAAQPGHRLLVIAGSGHTAILKDLLAIDMQRTAEDVNGYLAP